MNTHIHLLGGTGRIGNKLVNSLKYKPINKFSNIWVYCDGNKAVKFNKENRGLDCKVVISYRNYSTFKISNLVYNNEIKKDDRHLIVNLRGVNSRIHWISRPLDSIEIQHQSIKNITESDIHIYKNSKLIHFSSQLCDLIESKKSLHEICEGEDSYRRAYMISRLHQESILSAFAFKHALFTKIIRLPAVYGFEDDNNSPWVLNAFVKQGLSNGRIIPRKGSSYVWLTHQQVLVNYLRDIITGYGENKGDKNVSYLRPPSIGIKINDLSCLVMDVISKCNVDQIKYKSLIGHDINKEDQLKFNFNLLKENIDDLIFKHSSR